MKIMQDLRHRAGKNCFEGKEMRLELILRIFCLHVAVSDRASKKLHDKTLFSDTESDIQKISLLLLHRCHSKIAVFCA